MKIHICGIYGCGKSTLARTLSSILKIPYYSLDDIKYEVKYSKIRSVKERLVRVKKISKNKSWITEGTWSDYAKDLFVGADVIILMRIPKLICCYRILKRQIKRKKEKEDTLIGAFKLLREVFNYYSKDRPVSILSHNKLIENSGSKFFCVKNNREIKKVISGLL